MIAVCQLKKIVPMGEVGYVKLLLALSTTLTKTKKAERRDYL
jgi:hypothetical protein